MSRNDKYWGKAENWLMMRYAIHKFDRILYERLVHCINARAVKCRALKFCYGFVGRLTSYSHDVMRCSYTEAN